MNATSITRLKRNLCCRLSAFIYIGLALEYGRADLPSRGPQPTLIRYQILDLAFTGPLQWRWGLLGIQSGLRPVNHCEFSARVAGGLCNSMHSFQVCLAASVELCDHLVGWKDISATSIDSESIYLDLTSECSTSTCSGLAYLWRETPCLTALSCPIYATATGNLPATPWIWKL